MSRFILHFSKLFKLFSDLGKYVSPCTPFPSGTKSASGAGRWGLTRQPIPFRFPVCSADGFGFYNNCSHTVILTGEELLPYAVAFFKKPKSRLSRMAVCRQRWRFFARKILPVSWQSGSRNGRDAPVTFPVAILAVFLLHLIIYP